MGNYANKLSNENQYQFTSSGILEIENKHLTESISDSTCIKNCKQQNLIKAP